VSGGRDIAIAPKAALDTALAGRPDGGDARGTIVLIMLAMAFATSR
jgi:hypothetical protein